MAKDLRSENNNLQEWREKRKEITVNLLKRVLDKLIRIKAKINQKSVCEMMVEIATDIEIEYKAVITPSAISKNETFKIMIYEANDKIKSQNTNTKYNLNGDNQYELFKLKSLIAKKEAKIKELEAIIERANLKSNLNIPQSIELNDNSYKYILQDLIKFTTIEGISYVDSNNNLINETNNNILISANIINQLSIK